MKVKRYNENNTDSELTPEIIDFTEWCLIKTIENRRYYYNKSQRCWRDEILFKKLTWDEIYLVYKSEKYNL